MHYSPTLYQILALGIQSTQTARRGWVVGILATADDEHYSLWQRPQLSAEKLRRDRDILSEGLAQFRLQLDPEYTNRIIFSFCNHPNLSLADRHPPLRPLAWSRDFSHSLARFAFSGILAHFGLSKSPQAKIQNAIAPKYIPAFLLCVVPYTKAVLLYSAQSSISLDDVLP